MPMIRTPPASRGTHMVVLDEVPIAGRIVNAVFSVDIHHQPGQVYLASACYYDSPPDGPETTIEAATVVEWEEYDAAGNELEKVLRPEQIAVAAMGLLEQHVEL